MEPGASEAMEPGASEAMSNRMVDVTEVSYVSTSPTARNGDTLNDSANKYHKQLEEDANSQKMDTFVIEESNEDAALTPKRKEKKKKLKEGKTPRTPEEEKKRAEKKARKAARLAAGGAVESPSKEVSEDENQ